MAHRLIAFKWIRILWRCWSDNTAYDESRYIASLRKHNIDYYLPLFAALPAQ